MWKAALNEFYIISIALITLGLLGGVIGTGLGGAMIKQISQLPKINSTCPGTGCPDFG